jgi:hypothetical protein
MSINRSSRNVSTNCVACTNPLNSAPVVKAPAIINGVLTEIEMHAVCHECPNCNAHIEFYCTKHGVYTSYCAHPNLTRYLATYLIPDDCCMSASERDKFMAASKLILSYLAKRGVGEYCNVVDPTYANVSFTMSESEKEVWDKYFRRP